MSRKDELAASEATVEILQVCCCLNCDNVKQTFGPVGTQYTFAVGDRTLNRLLKMEKDGRPVARKTGEVEQQDESERTIPFNTLTLKENRNA